MVGVLQNRPFATILGGKWSEGGGTIFGSPSINFFSGAPILNLISSHFKGQIYHFMIRPVSFNNICFIRRYICKNQVKF